MANVNDYKKLYDYYKNNIRDYGRCIVAADPAAIAVRSGPVCHRIDDGQILYGGSGALP